MTIETEVAVVGAGVAGQTLAALLHARGIDHVVLDRRTPAGRARRGLALAETIPPGALPLLQSLGLLSTFETAAVQQTHGYHWSWGSERVDTDQFFGRSRFQHGFKLDKARLVRALEQRSVSRRVRYDGSLAIHEAAEGLELSTSCDRRPLVLRARVVVDASGRQRAVAQQLGASSQRVDDLLGFSCHLPRVDYPGLVHGVYAEAFEHGWGLVSRLDEATNVLSVFTCRHSPVRKQLMHYASWPSILAHTMRLGRFAPKGAAARVIGSDAASTRLERSCGANWLAIGDAAFTLDPLSSHGITNAVYSANRAVAAIAARRGGQSPDAFADYANSMTNIFHACLAAKLQRYRMEGRWRDAPFWRRAQQLVE